ncbi:Protein transport protein Sec31A [Cichlidogyrus casuarinus]|uniref:Protein transport protein Sec31A n=1 Tax=Cichlidogyrus casuarinus TaxID=1844966 RepID=A0ABD2QD12_9PLAT
MLQMSLLTSRKSCLLRLFIYLSSTAITYLNVGFQDKDGIALIGSREGTLSGFSFESSVANFSPLNFELLNFKHSGPVRYLDAPLHRGNIFASCSDNSQLFLWDLNSCNTSPVCSLKSSTQEVLVQSKFNTKVGNILASTSSSNCVVWDIRNCTPVMRFSKSMCQFEPVLMCWSPESSTHLALCDPLHPYAEIQLWDVRHAKHSLSILCRWISDNRLGLNATVETFTWGSAHAMGVDQHSDHNLLAVTLSANGGSLPDYLTVWQAGPHPEHPSCSFMACLGDSIGDSISSAQTLSGQPPPNVSLDWIPHPQFRGCLSYTESSGLISIHDVLGSRWRQDPQDEELRSAISSGHCSSRKIADAFGEEELSDLTSTLLLNQSHTRAPAKITNGHSLPVDPIPSLLHPPNWMKPSSGVNFSCGGKLLSWAAGPTRTKSGKRTNPASPNSFATTFDHDLSLDQVMLQTH